MKSLNQYVVESLDIDNLSWKIDKWFYNRPDEKNAFDELCIKFKNTKATKDSIEQYLQGNSKKVKPFIDFLNDTVLPPESRDYIYLLSKVVDTINANKSNENI